MGGAKNLLIVTVIKVLFLNIRDWPVGAATSITLTIVIGLMLLVYWRASRLLNKKVELELSVDCFGAFLGPLSTRTCIVQSLF